mgnify:CR=1 FL=1
MPGGLFLRQFLLHKVLHLMLLGHVDDGLLEDLAGVLRLIERVVDVRALVIESQVLREQPVAVLMPPARDLLSADAALYAFQLAVRDNVQYLDGGWQSLVDALRARECGCGAGAHQRVEVQLLEQVALCMAAAKPVGNGTEPEQPVDGGSQQRPHDTLTSRHSLAIQLGQTARHDESFGRQNSASRNPDLGPRGKPAKFRKPIGVARPE